MSSAALVETSHALLQAREKYPGFGSRWVVSRVLTLAVGIAAVVMLHPSLRAAGTFALGFIVGLIGKDITFVVRTRKKWAIHEQLYDWAKMESLVAASDDAAGELPRRD